MQFEQCGLAATRGAGNGDRLASLDPKTDIVDYPAVIGAVPEAEISDLDHRWPWQAGHWIPHGSARLGLGQRDVCQALSVQTQHLQIDDAVDQFADPLEELVLVGDEGNQQAYG